MTKNANRSAEEELSALRDDLLRGRPRPLRPDEGAEAFQQHKLLAAAVHRAAKLDEQKRESETDAWVRYVTEHFPPGRNDADDARLLFADWRTSLLKKDTPGPGIAITHGQSAIHWQRNEAGRLCLNLEDTWDDYAASVASFIEHLRASSRRRKIVVARWRKQRWIVGPFIPAYGARAAATVMNVPLSASMANSSTIGISRDGESISVPPAHSVTASAPPPTARRRKRVE